MAASTDGMALEAVDLVKTYSQGRGKPALRALDGLTFRAGAGTVFGLLGPNGAGKSTTVKILSTLSRPDSGDAFVAGIDVRRHPEQVRRAIGFVAQKQVSDPLDTGVENLVLAGQLQGMSTKASHARAGELLERFSLTAAAGRQVKTYSGGMARKLDVAIGLMHSPEVLFLDEPTTGLDPEARSEMWAEIERMSRHDRMTVLLTTHYLEEADRLADRLAIVDRGRIVTEGTPEELKSGLRGDAVVLELHDADLLAEALAAIGRVPGLRDVNVEGGRIIRARADDGGTALPLALSVLDAGGFRVASATVSRPSLDDVYLAHTGHSFAAAQDRSARQGADDGASLERAAS
ncbi:MAG: ATP-binding cassette domain-containing protein [Leifsonia sp.]